MIITGMMVMTLTAVQGEKVSLLCFQVASDVNHENRSKRESEPTLQLYKKCKLYKIKTVCPSTLVHSAIQDIL